MIDTTEVGTRNDSNIKIPTSPEESERLRQTASYCAAFVALGLTLGSFGPTLPGLAAQTQTRLHEISFLFSARSLGYLCGSFRGGHLYDRVPGHRVMALMLFIMAVMMALVPLMSHLWWLTIVVFILGGAEGGLDVGGNTLLVWVHGKGVGPYMNGLHFFFGVGAFLSPIIVAQMLPLSRGVSLSYWALAILLPPAAVWLLRLRSPAIQAVSEKGTAKVNRQSVILIALFLFLYVGAEVSFGGWIYTYTVTLNLSNVTRAAYLTSAFWGSLTLGRLLAIPLATRFSPRSILFCDLAGCLLSVGIILLWSGSFTAVLVGAIGLGLSMASIFPVTLSIAGQRLTITGKITGWFIVGASAGSMFLPWLIGQFFEQAGPRSTMFIIMAALIGAAGTFTVLICSSAQPTMNEDGVSV